MKRIIILLLNSIALTAISLCFGSEQEVTQQKPPIIVQLPEKSIDLPYSNLPILEQSKKMKQLYLESGRITLPLSLAFFEQAFTYMSVIANQEPDQAREVLDQMLQSESLKTIAQIINQAQYLEIPLLFAIAKHRFIAGITQPDNLKKFLENKTFLQQFNLAPAAQKSIAQQIRTSIMIDSPLQRSFSKKWSANEETIKKIRFDTSGNHMITSGVFELVLWDLKNKKPTTLHFHPIIWDLQANQPIVLPVDELVGLTTIFSPDGTKLAATSKRDTVLVWDIQEQEWQELYGHTNLITSLAFNSSGTLIASGSLDKTIEIWKLEAGKRRQRITSLGQSEPISSVAFSPDSKHIIATRWDKKMTIIDAQTAKIITMLEHPTDVFSASYTPNGNYIIARAAQEVYVWDVQKQIIIQTLRHATLIGDVVMNAQGTLLATASQATLKLWNLVSGELLHAYQLHDASNVQLVFGNDSTIIASTDNNLINVWDISSGTLLQTMTFAEPISSIAFDPSRQQIAVSQGISVHLETPWTAHLTLEELLLVIALEKLGSPDKKVSLDAYPYGKTLFNGLKKTLQTIISRQFLGKNQ